MKVGDIVNCCNAMKSEDESCEVCPVRKECNVLLKALGKAEPHELNKIMEADY